MKPFLFALFSLVAITSQAQYISGFQQEYFYGNLPSAKVEAMGMADVAVGGSVASIFFNSAGLSSIEEQEAYISTSAPFYVLENSRYLFLGYARRINPWLVTSLSINRFSIGATSFGVNLNGNNYLVTKGVTTNYALSAAASPIDNLSVGLNVNIFRWNIFEDISASHALHLDVGAQYKIELPDIGTIIHHAQLGVSLNNFTSNSITWSVPNEIEGSNELPFIGRFGAAYFVKIPVELPKIGEGSIDVTATTEYAPTFNSDEFNTFSIGTEAMLYQMLAVRLGWFNQTIDDFNNSLNLSSIQDFTYGFGLVVPVNKLTKDKFPMLVHIDYTNLQQPPQTTLVRSIPNLSTFSIRAVWTPKTQG
ncbi:hypothetical protein [Pontibacter sp. G13]|uniref:hypothetical protein n=1 Tax=Pontibacter sp. G13 TaxID=3074898 RepID=UPI00288B97AB|nr:hypothetical protein [Pontibacter sp. G13]WNJ19129.1 hypothetical protein RJD25_01445 [Pontibacter sp. G13]